MPQTPQQPIKRKYKGSSARLSFDETETASVAGRLTGLPVLYFNAIISFPEATARRLRIPASASWFVKIVMDGSPLEGTFAKANTIPLCAECCRRSASRYGTGQRKKGKATGRTR